jgi:hypothetical protein
MKPIHASLKTIALVLLFIKTAIGVLYILINTNDSLFIWYLKQPDHLGSVNAAISLVLVVFFAAYCYVRDYMAVFYGIVWISALVLLTLLYRYFNPGHITLNFEFVLFVVHALTILLSNARTNRWLRFYAIALIALWLMRAFNLYIFSMLGGLLPLIFIFMLMRDEKDNRIEQNDLLDDETNL